MWWNHQILDRPKKSKDGRVWHFKVWHGFDAGEYRQQIFFWDDEKLDCGSIKFRADQRLHVSQLKQRIQKIITDRNYRSLHIRELKFPIEKNYPE